jgi:hypothetical protein
MVEQLIRNQQARGSIPRVGSMKFQGISNGYFFFDIPFLFLKIR